MVSGMDFVPSPAEYRQVRDELLEEQIFVVPGWESFNPLEDARADDIRIRNHSDNVKEIAGRQGRNGDQIIRQSGAEKKLRDGLGLELSQRRVPAFQERHPDRGRTNKWRSDTTKSWPRSTPRHGRFWLRNWRKSVRSLN